MPGLSSCRVAVKPKFVYNDFGGAFGGPIIKDKLFYFGSYEATNDREAAFYYRHCANAAIKSGQHARPEQSDLRSRYRRRQWRKPTPFPDQIVPAARMDPIAVKLAARRRCPTWGGIYLPKITTPAPLTFLTGNGLTQGQLESELEAARRLDLRAPESPNIRIGCVAQVAGSGRTSSVRIVQLTLPSTRFRQNVRGAGVVILVSRFPPGWAAASGPPASRQSDHTRRRNDLIGEWSPVCALRLRSGIVDQIVWPCMLPLLIAALAQWRYKKRPPDRWSLRSSRSRKACP